LTQLLLAAQRVEMWFEKKEEMSFFFLHLILRKQRSTSADGLGRDQMRLKSMVCDGAW
jgi:hypothetical protein